METSASCNVGLLQPLSVGAWPTVGLLHRFQALRYRRSQHMNKSESLVCANVCLVATRLVFISGDLTPPFYVWGEPSIVCC